MTIPSLSADIIGLPKFDLNEGDFGSSDYSAVSFFDLSSHNRAKAALDFGLKMRSSSANMFVVGSEDSGRMMATIAFLKDAVRQLPPVFDWIYLNNFISEHRPLPFRLPSGLGHQLQMEMVELIESIHEVFNKTFSGPTFMAQVNALTSELEAEVRANIEKVQKFANSKGLHVESGPDEFTISPFETSGKVSKMKQSL